MTITWSSSSTVPCNSHLLSAFARLHDPTKMALKIHYPFLQVLKVPSQCSHTHSGSSIAKRNNVFQNARPKISCSMSMAAGQSGDSHKIDLNILKNNAKKLWDSSPEPVKSFPWNTVLENFIQNILDLVLVVVKYLSVPLFFVTSLSEMSYCAHERKLKLVPIPLLIGFAITGLLSDTALELSPLLKDAEVPWHLIATAIFFVLLKLPGPYYPYWGRIVIPQFANGALLRTLWLAFLWYRRPNKVSGSTPLQSSKYEPNTL